jgi:hypothetical protein
LSWKSGICGLEAAYEGEAITNGRTVQQASTEADRGAAAVIVEVVRIKITDAGRKAIE